MRLPLNGPLVVTTEYLEKGYGNFGKHAGLDYRAAVRTPLYSPGNGVVTASYQAASGNQIIELKIADDLWRFLHLSARNVRKGDRVTEGQLIGNTGNSGGVAAHLHVDVRKDGTAWDASLANYRDPRTVVSEANQPKYSAGKKNPKSVTLKAHVEKWAYYKVGTPLPLKRVNRAGELSPKKWGGLTYHNPTWVADSAMEITSPSLGKIWIYVDGDAEIRY